MNKKVEIIFDEEAYKEYVKLKELVKEGRISKKKPTYNQLLNSIDKNLNNIKINPYHGDLIPKKYITKEIIKKYGTDKILRVELIGYWRLLYTLIGDEIKIIAFILDYMNHDQYNKLFRYRKR